MVSNTTRPLACVRNGPFMLFEIGNQTMKRILIVCVDAGLHNSVKPKQNHLILKLGKVPHTNSEKKKKMGKL